MPGELLAGVEGVDGQTGQRIGEAVDLGKVEAVGDEGQERRPLVDGVDGAGGVEGVAGDEPTGSLGERLDGVVAGKRLDAVGEQRVDVDSRL